MARSGQLWRLASDDDGHWYLIMAQYLEAFQRWVETEEVEVPPYAQRLSGHPNRVTFTDPLED